MNKVLSICIPSFNMEEYIKRSVDSLIVDEILDKLEIIIVNDGSRDKTLEIANNYKQKYPNSIIVIDKENGHYGSCVNAALKIATGKYFRILDADDWFDSKALITFVNTIENIDVDVVYSHFTTHNFYTKSLKTAEINNITYNKKISLNDISLSTQFFRMHCLTYMTIFLKNINYYQTEGICYTDTQYVYFPLRKAQYIFCLNISLYQYYIGRDDQSVSTISSKKNFNHFLIIFDRFIKDPDIEIGTLNKNATNIRNYYIELVLDFIVELYIPYLKHTIDLDDKIRSYLNDIETNHPHIYKKLCKKNIARISYVITWHKPTILRQFKLSLLRLYISFRLKL